jgi:hypothetical protein
MPTENSHERAHQGVREGRNGRLPMDARVAPSSSALPALLGDPEARYLATHHAILAKLIEHRRRQ